MTGQVDEEGVFVPLEHLHIAASLTLQNAADVHGKSIDANILHRAIETVQTSTHKEDRDAAWEELLRACPLIDMETSRSVYSLFLEEYPVSHSVRSAWLYRELDHLISLSKCAPIENTAATFEVKTSLRILISQLQKWCVRSFNVDLWLIRMALALLFSKAKWSPLRDGFLLKTPEKANETRSLDEIFEEAVKETPFDPSGYRLWYFYAISVLHSTQISAAETKKHNEFIHRFLRQPINHSASPISDILVVNIGKHIQIKAPAPIATLFPGCTALQPSTCDELKNVQKCVDCICNASKIPQTILSLSPSAGALQHWFDLFECIEKRESRAETDVIAAAMHGCFANPNALILWLFAYYHTRMLDESLGNAFRETLTTHWPKAHRELILLLQAIYAESTMDITSRLEFIEEAEAITPQTKDQEDTLAVLTMQKMFLLFYHCLRRSEADVHRTKEYKQLKEVVMQYIKKGAVRWHVFAYLCSIEAHLAAATQKPEHAKRIVTAILAQASKHAGNAPDFFHRRADFADVTQNVSELTVAFENMIQRNDQKPRGASVSLWGRFYEFLKGFVPTSELEAYEHRRDRAGFGSGLLIAEKSWRGDGVVETMGSEENVPLTALQKLVLSSGPAGHESLLRRYGTRTADSSSALDGLVSSNELDMIEAKQRAWRHELANDASLKKNLRNIGLRVLFDADEDSAKIASTLPVHREVRQKEDIDVPLPFMLERAEGVRIE